jgi:predicted  nucleic acid-binding Zn-ribbon protein
MLKVIEDLLVLQDRDRKIRALKNELTTAPLERKQFDDKLTGIQTAFEQSKLKGKTIEVERKKLEIEAQTKRDQINKYQTQKFQTKKNDEYQAITTAIEHLERDISALEDKELELMESAEQLRPETLRAEQAAGAAKTQVAGQQADLNTKVTAVQEQIAKLEEERTRLAGNIEEDLRDVYDRLFATKGEAVVPLENEVCTGCHMKVTASTNNKVKAGKEVVQCEQCNRILYRVAY